MSPEFSLIFLTTLIGAGQGLFIAMASGQPYRSFGVDGFGFIGSVVSLGLLLLVHRYRPDQAIF
ncbi:MAG: hypothetical protein OEQ39_27610 [Gammaproteobacteria bacterium]|nr:hypothetical protein [Gammaproteobacteria bacterium]MDH3467852.1 hypothetical protein [Gammaproteobacteria bacterium]